MLEHVSETEKFLRIDPDKQRRIIEAAVSEFAEKGYTSASMNIVAENASIAKGSLFKYFRSKKGLFGFIYNRALRLVKDYLREVRENSKDLDFFARIGRLMEKGVEFIETHPCLAQIYFRIIYTGDAPYKKEILQELHGESLEFLKSFVEKGIERGELRRDIDPYVASFMLESLVDRFLQAHFISFLDPKLNLRTGKKEESRRWIRETLSLYETGMRNTISPICQGEKNAG